MSPRPSLIGLAVLLSTLFPFLGNTSFRLHPDQVLLKRFLDHLMEEQRDHRTALLWEDKKPANKDTVSVGICSIGELYPSCFSRATK